MHQADYADARRLIVARHAELDAVHQRVAYCERFYGSSMARMNGRLLRLASVEPEIPGTRGRHTEKRRT